MKNEGEAFQRFFDVVARLRSPGGCPWDLEQTPLSLRGDLIEETYECIEAIDENDPAHVMEELGDIFLLVAMLAFMHEQEGLFSVVDTLDAISEKLVRRHPHVFNDESPVLSTGEVLQNWTRIKVEQEGRKPKDSILDEVHRGLPPLDKAYKLQKKAAKAGFDWPDSAGVIAKIREELGEVEAAISTASAPGNGSSIVGGPAIGSGAAIGPDAALPEKTNLSALEEELGDLLFSAVNLCRFFKIEPSLALQKTNRKFTERFKHVERRMKENGLEMKSGNLEVMDEYWEEAKNNASSKTWDGISK